MQVILIILKSIFVPIFTFLAWFSRKLAYYTHAGLMKAEWCINHPDYFNHDCDLYYQWEKFRLSHWLERGVYNSLALQVFQEPELIELCCAEGFYTKYFYSKIATDIYACDYCKKAIKSARRKYSCSNIVYDVADIRYNIPDTINGKFPTNVIWDAGLAYFSPEEIDTIMNRISHILAPQKGILSGQTICERVNEIQSENHKYEFKNMEDLRNFFLPYFKNVLVFETIYDDRTNFYFYASDGDLPFSKDWDHGLIK